MAKTYTETIITAGPLQKRILRPRVLRSDSDKARAGKRQLSSEAQRLRNNLYSWQKLELQLAANYGNGDLFVTPTYARDEFLPKDEAEAERHIKAFLRCVRAELKKRGQPFRCHWVTEHKHASECYERDKRWHHHLAMTATGDDIELLQRCWPYGNVDVQILRFDGSEEHSYAALAHYMCKESREKPGRHVWHHTRSIAYPCVETHLVEADTTLQKTRGAIVLETKRASNRYGRMEYLKVLLPHRRTAPRAKRRRKR